MAGFILEIIDIFPRFLSVWDKIKKTPLPERPEAWEDLIMKDYPELLEKLIDDYRSNQVDWKKVSKEKVFPFLEDRFLDMYEAHDNLMEILPGLIARFERETDRAIHGYLVIYVGIGCGAGWVTEYRGKPAILLGLENVAECCWHKPEALLGLLAHELGHLYQKQVREEKIGQDHFSSFTQLFEEGFAHWFEMKLRNKEQTHIAVGINPSGWDKWCEENKSFLAKRFLNKTSRKEDTSEFFGHWQGIYGWKSCGFYLGYLYVKSLFEKGYSIEEVASFEKAEEGLKDFLEEIMLEGKGGEK